MGSEFNPIQIIAIILALMIAIIGHEIMHGLVAYHYKDDTAKKANRLSINPIVHIDIIGTIIVPAMLFIANAPFLFGWAKPVPVNMQRVINTGGYFGAINVSLAGIIYNLVLAIVASIILTSIYSGQVGFIEYLLLYLVIYNIVLAIFNLWPIPPLDGANALVFIALKLKIYAIAKFYQKIESYGMILLIIVLATPLSSIFFEPARILINILL